MQKEATMLLPGDHIDLLISAAHDWDLITTTSTGPLQAIGQSLHSANIASEQAKKRLGRLEPKDAGALQMATRDYTWRPVTDPYQPIDVLKACHAALEACNHAPQWTSTRLHHTLCMLAVAAAQRLPGYDTAPWIWQRAETITCAIGWAGTDHPQGVAGLIWCDKSTLEEQWDSAVLIVLTPSALDELDITLPPRRDLIVLTNSHSLTEEQWTVIAGLGTVTVVDTTVGLPWLEDLLAHLNRHVPATH